MVVVHENHKSEKCGSERGAGQAMSIGYIFAGSTRGCVAQNRVVLQEKCQAYP